MDYDESYQALDCIEIEDIIGYLKLFGYKVVNQDQIAETIETDIRGAEMKANGQTYKFGGMIKIIVGAE